jgi:hypothetical protein
VIIPKLPRWFRPLVAFAGLGVFVGGVITLFAIDNSAGSLFLVALGMVLTLVALLGRRIELESFELLGARARIRQVVAGRLQLAEAAVGRGEDPGSGIRAEALALQKLAGLHDLYRYARRTQRGSSERTAIMDAIALRMQTVAAGVAFDPAEVATWFQDGDDALRVIALNVMLVRPECRDVPALLHSIEESRSAFEQFYGLRLARSMVDDLEVFERRLLAAAIGRAQRRRGFRRDSSRAQLADEVLARIG